MSDHRERAVHLTFISDLVFQGGILRSLNECQ